VEIERLEFKVVMDDGLNTEVLARVAHLDLAGPAYRAAVLKYPNRNIALRHGARIIEQHLGEPPPPPLVQRDPNLKSWSAHLIGGKKMQLLGYIEAVSEAAAIERPSFSSPSALRLRFSCHPSSEKEPGARRCRGSSPGGYQRVPNGRRVASALWEGFDAGAGRAVD
jgi:hypothetical protein